jgi:hypothetical protein
VAELGPTPLDVAGGRSHTSLMTAVSMATAAAPTGRVRSSISNRAWFDDARGPGRRLQVTAHGDTIVFSTWHDDVCAASSQVPIAAAPQLIAHLAECLSQATITVAPAPVRAAEPRSTHSRIRRAIDRRVAWFRSRRHA